MSDVMTQALAMLSDKLAGFDGSIKFVIEDMGTIMVDGAGVRAADEEAECTLTADADTLQGILSGDINPTSAFMTGKLKVDGDMSQAMKLGAMLA